MSENLGLNLSFEGSDIFVGILEVGFLALRTKKNQYLSALRDPVKLLQMRKFCNLVKMAMFKVQKKSTYRRSKKMFDPSKDRS